MESFRQQHSYKLLLFTLTGLLLFVPLLQGKVASGLIVVTLIYLPFIAAVFTVLKQVNKLRIMLSLIALVVISEILLIQNFSTNMFVLNHLSSIAFYGYLGSLITVDVLVKRKTVSTDMIAGILCVYLLIGLFFADLYGLIHYYNPDSFAGVKFIEEYPLDWTTGFIYFSFVTLTTLGYGDISPNTIEAGSFVYMEAIIGQIFLTVLVARLVGIHISQSK